MDPRKKEEYKQVVKLRFQGKGYGEIAKETGVAKSTVSRWCKHLKLPPGAQEILKKKSNYPRELFAEYNRLKSERVKRENKAVCGQANKEVQGLSQYELKLVGAALYWSEGYKIEKQKSGFQICFVNSDPYMMALFSRFLKEIMRIPGERFRLSAHIYPGMNKESVVDFWSRVIDVPVENFRVCYQVSRASQGKRAYNTLPFGTLKLFVSGRQNAFRVKGWIDALKNQSGFKE